MINTIKNFISNMVKPYVGVPAPKVLKDDPWFGPAFISDANKEYLKQQEHEAFKEEAHKYYGTKEPENIHEMMYQMATNSQGTSLQRDPIEQPGGSENFHEGPGGWNSGNGWGNFS